jgi:hypothetical protein
MTELTLAFHKSLYLPAAVAAAAEAYDDYAEAIDVVDADVETKVTLRGFDERYGEVIGDAFANHALFETVVRSRQKLGGVAA